MKIKLLENGIMPTRATNGSAGYDIYSPIDVVVPARGKIVVQSNICLEIPQGYAVDIRSRSGLAFKSDIEAFHGLIDSDFRGSLGILLRNFGDKDVEIKKGERMAQFIIQSVSTPDLEIVEELSDTDRGQNGFGSTGR